MTRINGIELTLTDEDIATLKAAQAIIDRLYDEATPQRFKGGKSIPKEVLWNRIDTTRSWVWHLLNSLHYTPKLLAEHKARNAQEANDE